MISLKKLTTTKKIKDIKRKLPSHDKPDTTDNCNKSTKKFFDHILKQNLTTKDVADFIKKAIFWWKAMKS